MSINPEVEEVNIIDLNKLDNVRPNGDGSWQAACPMCRHEGSDKTGDHLRVYQTMAFHCVKYRNDKAHNAAILTLAGTKGSLENIPKVIHEPKLNIEEIYPDSILTRLIKNHEYWVSRGISAETMLKFEGGVALSGKMLNRYVFPMRDRNGRIHGFTGRYILPIKSNGIARWKHLGKKENWIFDRENVMASIQKSGIAILTEGIGCKLALKEVGIDEVVPIFGVVPSSHIIATLIALNPKKIYASLNNEPGNTKATLNGNEAANRTLGILSNFFSEGRLIGRLPDQKDWLDCSMEQRLKFKNEIYG